MNRRLHWLLIIPILLMAKAAQASSGAMNQARAAYTLTPLETGKILAAGGYVASMGTLPLTSAELYNPLTATWTYTGFMHKQRSSHTANLLQDGRVIVAAGTTNAFLGGVIPDAEIYDPGSGLWSLTGSLQLARMNHASVTLQDGRVLLMGGDIFQGGTTTEAELFDVSSGQWSLAAPMHHARSRHTATLLNDGRVLVSGGDSSSASAEIYNPATNTWTDTGTMTAARVNHTATLLADGTVLVAGGYSITPINIGAALSSAEIYDPATNQWTTVGSMANAHSAHSANLLGDGTVVVTGGQTTDFSNLITLPAAIGATEIYHPLNRSWTSSGALQQARTAHSAVAIGGIVFASGGLSITNGVGTPLTTAEVYNPAIQTWSAPAFPPAAPTNVSAIAGDGQAILSWSLVPGATSYTVYGSTSPFVSPTDDSIRVSTVSSPAIIGNLTNGIAYHFAVTALNSGGESIQAPQVPVTPSASVTITSQSPPGLYSFSGYYYILTASGGRAPYQWSVVSGALPTGISLSSSGILSGAPSGVNTASPFTVQAADSQGQKTQVSMNLGAYKNAPFQMQWSQIQDGKVINPGDFTTFEILYCGQATASSCNLYSDKGFEQAGIDVSQGLPIPETEYAWTPDRAGPITLWVVASLLAGDTLVSLPVHINGTSVAPLVITSTGLPPGVVGQPYSASIQASGGVSPYIWSTSAQTLPAGLLISTGGVISGTPTTVGTSTFTAMVMDSLSASATQVFSIPVAAQGPTNVQAFAGSTQALVSWTPVPGVFTYKVYGALHPGVTKSNAAFTLNVFSFDPLCSAVGLTNGTSYYFAVSAWPNGLGNPSSETSLSNEVSALPQTGSALPSITVQITAPPSGSTVTLGSPVQLTMQAMDPVSPYLMDAWFQIDGQIIGDRNFTGTITNPTNSVLWTPVALGTHTLTAIARSGDFRIGQGSFVITVQNAGSLPATPTGVTMVPHNSRVDLSWLLVTGAQAYQIYYSASPGVPLDNTHFWASVTGSSVTITGLANNLPTYAVVVASNSFGLSAASMEVSATPDDRLGMRAPRSAHSLTVLKDGRILVTGGWSDTGHTLDSAEIYDPATTRWTVAGTMSTPRRNHTATLLPDGRVLVAGGGNGYNSDSEMPTQTAVSADIFNPSTGQWTPTGALATGRFRHTATLLPDGRVLVAGGIQEPFDQELNSSEIYNPSSGQWTAAPNLAYPIYDHTATLLKDGRLMLTGGWCSFCNQTGPELGAGLLNWTAILDAGQTQWIKGPVMNAARYQHEATLLSDGRLLVTGYDPSAEVFDPSSSQWMTLGFQAATYPTATLLQNGRVLLAGGGNPLTRSDLVDPSNETLQVTGALSTGRTGHKAAQMYSGRVLIVGGINIQGTTLDTAEQYDPTSGTWSAPTVQTPPLVIITPAHVTLVAGQQQTFVANVFSNGSQAVNWSLNPTVGSISNTGIYTAPSLISSTQDITITATSQVDQTQSTSAVVSLVPISVTVSPSTSIFLLAGATQQFLASVTGTGQTAVTWSVSPASGTISTAGLYQAPSLIRTNQTVTVTATSTQDPTKFGIATMALLASTTLSVSQSSMTFNYESGGAVPPPQTLTVSSTGGPLSYTAQACCGAFLWVSPSSGTTPGNLIVSIDPTGLPLGLTYNGTITITAAGAANSPVVIPVSLTIAQPLAINTFSFLTTGYVNIPYSLQYVATGGQGSYTWSQGLTALPPGFSFSSAGVLSGIPTSTGSFAFQIAVADGAGHHATQNYLLPISSAVPTLIAASPTSLNFVYRLGDPIPTSLSTIGVTSSNPSNGVAFSVSEIAAPGSTCSWETVTPGGTAPSAIIAGPIDPTGFSTGTYTCNIRISAPQAANSPVIVPATLTILQAAAPSSLPAPILHLPSTLPIDTDIILGIPSGYTYTRFEWSITQAQQGSSAASPSLSVIARSGSAAFSTQAAKANAAEQGLTPGYYMVSVTGFDSNGNSSAPATAFTTFVAADLTGIRVHPSPWRSDLHTGHDITFDGLPADSTIKIFTVSGRWVKTISNANGSANWNLRNDDGDMVASGLYIYLVTDTQGNKTHGKFGIIR